MAKLKWTEAPLPISNFYFVCYYDKHTGDLAHIEKYNDGDGCRSDIESYAYGYRAYIYKPEGLLAEIQHLQNRIKEVMNEKYEVKNG